MFSWPSMGNSPKRHGIIFAVWGDSVVLMAMNQSKPGENLRIAKLKEGVKPFMEQLEMDGVFNIKNGYRTVPDASYFSFKAEYDSKSSRLAWDEYISRGYGSNNKPDQHYRDFVKAWFMMRITWASVRLVESREISDNDLVDGKFRGYDVENPHKTSWHRN